MATVVGIESDPGVVLAGDRRVVADGRIESAVKPHVHHWDGVGVAVVGDVAGMDRFVREFESDLRTYRLERGEPAVDPVTRLASQIAAEAGVEALVAARDEEGVARLRAIDVGGGIRRDACVALGSGAKVALGILESTETGDFADVEAVEERARVALGVAADRDAGTGEEVDVWRLGGGTD